MEGAKARGHVHAGAGLGGAAMEVGQRERRKLKQDGEIVRKTHEWCQQGYVNILAGLA
jgi:hypothetical protein